MRMSRLYSLADVTANYVGHYRGNPLSKKTYGRIVRAIALGECGHVRRMGRGWALNAKNVARLAAYMRRRWKIEPRPEQVVA
jgi:hypothetical protein